LLLATPRHRTGRDRFFERSAVPTRDAVLTLTVPLTEEHTLALHALDMPLVAVDAALPGVSSVRIDDVGAMRTGCTTCCTGATGTSS
jgi:DNA-binding LacI/PurR family transcriptional regulator